MFDFLFRSRHKRESDRMDAANLIERYGREAYGEARRRATDSALSTRNRRHWGRVGRIVASMQRNGESEKQLLPSE